MTAAEACELVVEHARDVSAARAREVAAWRSVALAAIHALHQAYSERTVLERRHRRALEENRTLRGARG